MARTKVTATETATVNSDAPKGTTKRASKKVVKNYYAGSVEAPAAQAMLKRIAKATSDKPLKASLLKGQYPNRIARMLASEGLVSQERREGVGVVFFPKAS